MRSQLFRLCAATVSTLTSALAFVLFSRSIKSPAQLLFPMTDGATLVCTSSRSIKSPAQLLFRSYCFSDIVG